MTNTKRRFADALRLFIGRGCRYETEAFAAASGFDRCTIDKHKRGESLPDLPNALVYLRHLPDEFANMVLASAGLMVTRREEGDAPSGPQLARSLSERLSMILRHFEDGFEDHRERNEACRELHALVAEIMAYVASREGAGS